MLVDTAPPAPSEPPPGRSPPGRRPDSAGVIFTLQGAADACGVDPKSIRRRRQQLEDHGSQRNEDGSWSIPLGALLAAGLHPGKPSPPDAPPGQHEVGGRPASPGAAPDAARIAELERLLLLEQVQRQAAEHLAAERKAWIADLQLALRAIEAGSAVAMAEVTADRPQPQPVTAAEPEPDPPPAPRRW